MTPDLPLLAGYPATATDEVVDSTGRLRDRAAPLRPVLDRADLPELADAATGAFRTAGGEVGVRRDGRPAVEAVPFDPVPRLLDRSDRATLTAGVAQRHRALEAFLADVYRAGGRRRGDPDRAPEIVRAGVLPEWAVAGSPGRDPAAVGRAWPGQRRIALLGCDVVRTGDGGWLVRADDACVPRGLGLAVAARRAAVTAPPAGVPDPAGSLGLLRAALAAAAPPACAGPPTLAVLTPGDGHGPPGEEAVLAEALDARTVTGTDLWPRVDGGVAATLDGRRVPVDVLLLRLDDAELAASRVPAGHTVGALLGEAVRAGRLGLTNVPGNALAEDLGLFPGVPAMIRFYLGEEPRLGQVATWVLADTQQWAAVRDRLDELVVVPVPGYGGGRTVVGPECSAAELAELQAAVAAAPHRFVAREHLPTSTVPALVGGRLLPRAAGLRIFSAAGGGDVQALEAPLSWVAPARSAAEVDLGRGAAVKDTWLLPS